MAGFFRKLTKGFFVTCNIILGVLFLLGCYGSSLNPEYFWFIGLLTLAALWMLLGLVIFMVFWLFVKRKFILISLIMILAAWVPLKHLIKLRVSPDFSITKSPGTLRIMSWNVEQFDILEHKKHPERKLEMLDMIEKYRPDIACFQEMVGNDTDSSAINFIPFFAERIHMPYYWYSFNPKVDFDAKHHFGIIIFSKYPFLEKHTISYEPNDYNSIFQYADIVKEQDTFRVFNIHLQSLKFSEGNRQYIDDPSLKSEADMQKSRNIISKLKKGFLKRKIQSERIRKAMDESPYPNLVCGDFNDVPCSYAYNLIGHGMKNCFAEKGSGIGRTFYSISPTLRIDNIFTDKRFKTQQFIRIKKKISDHFPIIADLSFDAGKTEKR